MRIAGVDGLAAPSATAARNYANNRYSKQQRRDRHHGSVAHDGNSRTATLSVQPGAPSSLPILPTLYRVGVRRPLQVAGLAACLIAGILAATALGGGTTTTETTTETVSEPTTVLTTATVEQTTTRQIIVPRTTSTSSTESSSETPTWVWVLLAILAVALVVTIVLLATRGGSSVAPEERRRRLEGAVASWTTQGWAVESQSGDSAILRRAGERMNVSVDSAGQVFTQPLSAGPPS
jgi:hypothetical protein